MKTKPAILTALLACAVLPLRAQNAPVYSLPKPSDLIQPGGPIAPPNLPSAELPPPVLVNPVVRAGAAENAPPPQAFGSGIGGPPSAAPSVGGPAPFGSYGPASSVDQVELRMQQIELEVALKQFEKIAAASVDAQTAAALLEQDELSDAQFMEKKKRAEEKVMRLTEIKHKLRSEIARATEELEARRKQLGLSADAPVLQGFGSSGGGASGKFPGTGR